MNRSFFENATIVSAAGSVDLNTAAIVGARVSLANADRVTVLVKLGTSLTGANVVFTLTQHNAASGGVSKPVLTNNPVYYKAGAALVFTKVEVNEDEERSEIDLSTVFDLDGGYVGMDVLAEELDTNNGFGYFSVNMEDGAVSKQVSVDYILRDTRFAPAYSHAV